jgi:hypothetical protein
VITATADNLDSILGMDFTTACGELAEVRFQQSCKDTPSHRAAVAEARGRIDAVLDMYLDTVGRGC